MKPILIVFICHTNEILEKIIQDYPTVSLFFVGNAEIDEKYRQNPNIIISRELPENIEDKSKFLTFTAWYAISKNRLFLEYEYICLFEYDVSLCPDFESKMTEMISQQNSESATGYDVFSFSKIKRFFFWDINPKLFYPYLEKKKVWYDILELWYNSTNQCIRRGLLDEFVDWYYPSGLLFWYLDRKMVSWYHERLFSVFLHVLDKSVYLIDNENEPAMIQHIGYSSHCKTMNQKMEPDIPLETFSEYLSSWDDLGSDPEVLAKIDAHYST